MSPSVHRTNHAACLQELCALIWDGLWTMEYKPVTQVEHDPMIKTVDWSLKQTSQPHVHLSL